MAEDLAEALNDQNTITIIEWADTVANILPENRITIKIAVNDDGSRCIEVEQPDEVKQSSKLTNTSSCLKELK